MRPQKRALVAAPFEHKPTESQMHSPLPNCEETRCNGLCLGRHVARKQARGVEPHMGKLQGDHAIQNYCPSKVGGSHVHAKKKVACTRERLWKVDRMYTRPRSQLHANRKRLCLLVKSNGRQRLVVYVTSLSATMRGSWWKQAICAAKIATTREEQTSLM